MNQPFNISQKPRQMQSSLKNYTLPFLAQSNPPPLKLYTSHLLPKEYQIPCYSLKSKQNITSQSLRAKTHQKPSRLTLLTYNIWFDEHNKKNRYQYLLRLLADSGADVICLQEVNKEFLFLLMNLQKEHSNLKNYFMSNPQMYEYDTVILSKYPCRLYKKVFQPSRMGRCSLTAVLQFQKLIEPQINSWYKLRPPLKFILRKIKKTLNQKMDMVIIAGDYNFGDNEWGDNTLQIQTINGYTDVWKTGKRYFSQWASEAQKQRGITMPTNLRFPCWRPDKIIYRSKMKIEAEKNEIQIIGDFTIPPFDKDHFTKIQNDDKVRTPSDHFGLMARITF